MYGTIVSILACFLAACEGIEILAGPSNTTQEVGSRFVLKCTVANHDPAKDGVFWKLFTESSTQATMLTMDHKSKDPDDYEIETGTYNLIVRNATYKHDGVFECEAGLHRRSARVYIYDKPRSMTLDWEHSVNRPGAVRANQEYKLRCTTKHSHPPATHRYFKNGVELSNIDISYKHHYDTELGKRYGDVTSTLPFTPNNEDVGSMKTVRCVADLYNKKNVSSIAFGINSATRSSSIGFGAALVVLMGVLLRE